MKNETVTIGNKDVLVVYAPCGMSEKERKDLKADIATAFGDVPVLILSNGISLGRLNRTYGGSHGIG